MRRERKGAEVFFVPRSRRDRRNGKKREGNHRYGGVGPGLCRIDLGVPGNCGGVRLGFGAGEGEGVDGTWQWRRASSERLTSNGQVKKTARGERDLFVILVFFTGVP